jgi:pimeloyl-CoA synthetase
MVRDYLRVESQNQRIRFLQIQIQKVKSQIKVLKTLEPQELEKWVEEDRFNFMIRRFIKILIDRKKRNEKFKKDFKNKTGVDLNDIHIHRDGPSQ